MWSERWSLHGTPSYRNMSRSAQNALFTTQQKARIILAYKLKECLYICSSLYTLKSTLRSVVDHIFIFTICFFRKDFRLYWLCAYVNGLTSMQINPSTPTAMALDELTSTIPLISHIKIHSYQHKKETSKSAPCALLGKCTVPIQLAVKQQLWLCLLRQFQTLLQTDIRDSRNGTSLITMPLLSYSKAKA